MNVQAIFSNGLDFPLNLDVAGEDITIPSERSLIVPVMAGTVVTIETAIPVVVRKTNGSISDLLPLNGNGQFPTFVVNEAATYGIFPEGEFRPNGPVSVKKIVDRILDQQCNFQDFAWNATVNRGGLGGFGYGVGLGGYGGFDNNPFDNDGIAPGVPFGSELLDTWGQSPCEYDKYQEVLGMLNKLLEGKTEEQRVRLLNAVVTTDVPNQGTEQVTLLEAAIIMRKPALVARLLALGADPNITTAGTPLLQQLIQAEAFDFYDTDFGEDEAIIDLLLRAGAETPSPYTALFDDYYGGQFPLFGGNYNPYFGYGQF